MDWNCEESQIAADFTDFCESAASLVDVGVLSQYRLVPISLPAHQLTRYQLTVPWDIHRDILKLSPNLVEGRIGIMFDGGTPWPECDRFIDLRSLQNLYVSHSEILAYLRFPRLEQIGIEITQDEEDSSAASCAAQTLMQDLTPSDGKPVLAPQLSGISFAFAQQSYVDRPIFSDMVKSRWEEKKCALHHAALLVNYTAVGPAAADDIATRDGLAAHREQGLDLVSLEGEACVECDG
ncbi:hypothetical protein C8R47DRAFT_1231496 [Mycena vitilis]|nr:hypothetical protein C8R47DRAFT_1231496 [Mycena vitilis]